MSMIIDEKTLGIWFVPIKPSSMNTSEGDWLGSLRREEDGRLKMTFRYRWYDPSHPDPWAGEDRKSWYSVDLKTVDDAAGVESARLMVKVVLDSQRFGGVAEADLPEPTELLMDENGHEDLMRRLLDQPFTSAQTHKLQ